MKRAKDLATFAVLGVIIQYIVYVSAKAAIESEMIIAAAILTATLAVNGFIFFMGCLRMSFGLLEETRKGRSDGKD